MRFDRRYDVYAFLGDPTATPPWVASVWAAIANALDPIMRAARDRPSVRTMQLGGPRQRPISFGRIGWNEGSARKWTHQPDGTLVSGSPAQFVTCEAWAPSWTVCTRDGLSPDLLFAMREHPDRTNIRKASPPPAFRAIGCLAAACDMGPDMATLGQVAAVGVAEAFRSVVRVRHTRAWGEPFGDIGFADAINDLVPAGRLFRGGNLFAADPSSRILAEHWTAF